VRHAIEGDVERLPFEAAKVMRRPYEIDKLQNTYFVLDDFRQLFEANDLRLLRSEFQEERRELERYLDLAGCEGDARNHACDLAPTGDSYAVTIGWYLLAR